MQTTPEPQLQKMSRKELHGNANGSQENKDAQNASEPRVVYKAKRLFSGEGKATEATTNEEGKE